MLNKTAAAVMALGLAGCASAAQTPSYAGLGLHEMMVTVIDPNANIFWSASGEIDTEEGSATRTPENEARWQKVVEAATVVRDTGATLGTARFSRPDPAWAEMAAKMEKAGAEGLAAAKARDADAAFTVGGDLYDACNGCHSKFIPGRS